MDWLNENALRSYPFVEGTSMDPYPAAIVDAVFALGYDIPFDFSDETAEIQLRSVSLLGTGATELVFQAVSRGAPVGALMAFTVPVGYQRHQVLRAVTPGSHAYITIDDITGLPVGPSACAVEPRTLTRITDTRPTYTYIYNAQRRASYVPYIPQSPSLTPAQRYNMAKAAAPSWQKNNCLDAPVALVAGVVKVVEGFRALVSAEPLTSTVTVTMSLSGPGSGCGIPGYVKKRLGSAGGVADIDGDGVVSSSDVLAAKNLVNVPPEISVQGVLRGVNGSVADRGELKLAAGPGTTITTSKESSTVRLELEELRLPSKCL